MIGLTSRHRPQKTQTAFPYAVDLEITTACNMACRHCFRDSSQKGDFLPANRLSQVISELYELGISELLITGGEPTCRPEWLDIVVDACKHRGMRVVLTTNGTKMTTKDIDTLSNLHEPPHIAFSLEAPDAESYGILRRSADGRAASHYFGKVVRTIERSVAAGLVTCVNIAVTEHTLQHVSETIDFAGRLGVQAILLLKPIEISEQGSRNRNGLRKLPYSSWSKLIKDLTHRKNSGERFFDMVCVSTACRWETILPLKELGANMNELTKLWNYYLLDHLSILKPLNSLPCSAGKTFCCIDAFGNVLPCSVAPLGFPSFVAGNVATMSFAEIWSQSTLMESFRAISPESLDPLGCGGCPELTWCGGGCRIRAIVRSGSVTASDPECPLIAERRKK